MCSTMFTEDKQTGITSEEEEEEEEELERRARHIETGECRGGGRNGEEGDGVRRQEGKERKLEEEEKGRNGGRQTVHERENRDKQGEGEK